MRIFRIILASATATAVLAFAMPRAQAPIIPKASSPSHEETGSRTVAETFATPAIPDPETEEIPRSSVQAIPFTSQAPSSQWSDSVFQNACEEASILMATAWIRGEESLPDRGSIEREIRSLSWLAEKRFGERSYDTSTEDTATILRTYSGSDSISVIQDVALDDIRRIVRKGNIVVAPFDGRKLGNTNYRAPGPEFHMLVIIGYDASTGEFITNDPGTRRGAGYRYGEDILFEAIRDYRTGYHIRMTGAPEKNVISVSRKTITD